MGADSWSYIPNSHMYLVVSYLIFSVLIDLQSNKLFSKFKIFIWRFSFEVFKNHIWKLSYDLELIYFWDFVTRPNRPSSLSSIEPTNHRAYGPFRTEKQNRTTEKVYCFFSFFIFLANNNFFHKQIFTICDILFEYQIIICIKKSNEYE